MQTVIERHQHDHILYHLQTRSLDPVVIDLQHEQDKKSNKCVVLLSPCLDTPIPLTNTSLDPCALVITPQCVTSTSPILVTATSFFPFN